MLLKQPRRTHTLMLSPARRAFIIVNPAFGLCWLNTEENNTSVGNSKVSSQEHFLGYMHLVHSERCVHPMYIL